MVAGKFNVVNLKIEVTPCHWTFPFEELNIDISITDQSIDFWRRTNRAIKSINHLSNFALFDKSHINLSLTNRLSIKNQTINHSSPTNQINRSTTHQSITDQSIDRSHLQFELLAQVRIGENVDEKGRAAESEGAFDHCEGLVDALGTRHHAQVHIVVVLGTIWRPFDCAIVLPCNVPVRTNYKQKILV